MSSPLKPLSASRILKSEYLLLLCRLTEDIGLIFLSVRFLLQTSFLYFFFLFGSYGALKGEAICVLRYVIFQSFEVAIVTVLQNSHCLIFVGRIGFLLKQSL